MPFKDLHNKIYTSDNTIESLQKIFYTTANHILNTKVLKILDLEIELTETEFYFFTCDNHSDPYVHIDSLQKTSNKLYVHKQAWNRKFHILLLSRNCCTENNELKSYILTKVNLHFLIHRRGSSYIFLDQRRSSICWIPYLQQLRLLCRSYQMVGKKEDDHLEDYRCEPQ